MSLEAIIDAAALKAAAVPGIKAAFGVGINAQPLPSQIADGPVATVMYDGTDVTDPTTFESMEHQLLIQIYAASADQGSAYKTLIPFVMRFITEWRTGRSLGGACAESYVNGAGAVDGVTIDGRPYARLPIRVTVREVTFGTTTSL